MATRVKTPEADGRSRRWDGHRAARRAELVEAAALALSDLGPEVHLARIAEAAGVSKPVLYRYFDDKDDLLGAVTRWEADRVLLVVTGALAPDGTPRERVERAVQAYLREVQQHRNLFLLTFRPHGRAVDGSVADGKSAVAAALARTLGDALGAAGIDTAGAEPWAQALVGLGLSTAQWWLEQSSMSREALTEYLTAFVWHAFDGISREYSEVTTYAGAAELVLGPKTLPVVVDLRGSFQPLDGLHHWWGRLDPDAELDALLPRGGAARLRTPYGEAPARLSDRDPWGRYRVTGTGMAPYQGSLVRSDQSAP